jgi:hypothetical protein
MYRKSRMAKTGMAFKKKTVKCERMPDCVVLKKVQTRKIEKIFKIFTSPKCILFLVSFIINLKSFYLLILCFCILLNAV